jgi:hypothetical protein
MFLARRVKGIAPRIRIEVGRQIYDCWFDAQPRSALVEQWREGGWAIYRQCWATAKYPIRPGQFVLGEDIVKKLKGQDLPVPSCAEGYCDTRLWRIMAICAYIQREAGVGVPFGMTCRQMAEMVGDAGYVWCNQKMTGILSENGHLERIEHGMWVLDRELSGDGCKAWKVLDRKWSAWIYHPRPSHWCGRG